MIKFFRQSYAIQYVVIAMLAIVLWLPAFIDGKTATGMESAVTPLFNLVNHLLSFSPYAQIGFAFFLLLVEALLLNSILVENQIVGKVGSMGSFVFVLLMSLTMTQTCFYPLLLSLFFILLVFKYLFAVHLSQSPELDLLKAGGCLALASMCYFPSIILVVWLAISLPMAQKGTFRLELIPFLGVFFVYFLFFSGVYLFGDFIPRIRGYQIYLLAVKLSVVGFNYKNIILLLFLITASIILFFSNSNLEKTNAVRVKIAISMVFLFFAVVTLFLGGNLLLNGLVFLALSILFAYEFTYMSNTGWADLTLAVFLLLVIGNHYYFKLL